MKKQNKKHESGRSMIEMVGVLAVMGLITAAAFVLITSAMRSQKLSRADDDISALVAGVRLLYNNSANFDGLVNQSANTLKALGFENVKSPYGSGGYTITPGTWTAATYNSSNELVTPAAWSTCTSGCDSFVISFDTGDENTCKGLEGRTWSNGGVAVCDGATLKIGFDSGK